MYDNSIYKVFCLGLRFGLFLLLRLVLLQGTDLLARVLSVIASGFKGMAKRKWATRFGEALTEPDLTLSLGHIQAQCSRSGS